MYTHTSLSPYIHIYIYIYTHTYTPHDSSGHICRGRGHEADGPAAGPRRPNQIIIIIIIVIIAIIIII